MLITFGLKKFVSMPKDTYVDLITEFNTTLDVNATNSQILQFRMLWNKHQLIYSFMQRVFGFKKDGLCDPPKTFRVNEFWTFLSDLPIPFQAKKGKAMFIKDLKFWLLHKVLACVVFISLNLIGFLHKNCFWCGAFITRNKYVGLTRFLINYWLVLHVRMPH